MCKIKFCCRDVMLSCYTMRVYAGLTLPLLFFLMSVSFSFHFGFIYLVLKYCFIILHKVWSHTKPLPRKKRGITLNILSRSPNYL